MRPIPSNPENQAFAAWVERRMAERRISNRVLALRAGTDHSTISRIRTGKRVVSFVTAIRIIQALGGSDQFLAELFPLDPAEPE